MSIDIGLMEAVRFDHNEVTWITQWLVLDVRAPVWKRGQ